MKIGTAEYNFRVKKIISTILLIVLTTTIFAQSSKTNIKQYSLPQLLKENENYLQYAMDYNGSDAVVLMVVNDCKIEDTIGAYTRQTVYGDVVKNYKGYCFQDRFSATIEGKSKWLKKGDTIGVFLSATDPKFIKLQHFNRLVENSGFTVKDTAFISALADKHFLHKLFKEMLDPSDPEGGPINKTPEWVKVKVLKVKNNFTVGLPNTFTTKQISVLALQNAKDNLIQKGEIYKVQIIESNYNNYHNDLLLQVGKTYLMPINAYDVADIPTSKIDFIIPLEKMNYE